jgi:SAM-dependent methyltransferase
VTTDDPELARTRAFFGPRAAGWDDRFPDDGPAYERAVAELRPSPGGVVLDAGCGTGRALDALRASVGPGGLVIAADVTREMLGEVRRRGRDRQAALVLADARRLPLADRSVDGLLAAGLLSHVGDPLAALRELARVTKPGGKLAVFHPIGRRALAARHGHEPAADDVRAGANLEPVLEGAGWTLIYLDDSDQRYLALAQRRGEQARPQ